MTNNAKHYIVAQIWYCGCCEEKIYSIDYVAHSEKECIQYIEATYGKYIIGSCSWGKSYKIPETKNRDARTLIIIEPDNNN